MDWLEIAVDVPDEEAEAVAELLQTYATGGVSMERWGDPDNLEPDALLPGTRLKIYVPLDQATPDLRRQIATLLTTFDVELPPPSFQTVAEQDWSTAWKARYRAFRIGRRFVVRPSWLEEEESIKPTPDDIPLILDPGMAFGTGLHATTQLTLTLLERVLQPGDRVLDVGTGSGILAIAAARLGAAEVLALDNDPVAVESAAENLRRNGVERQVSLAVGELAAVAAASRRWDVVLVNILAPVIVELLAQGLLERVASAGWLLLSGVIEQQVEMVSGAVEAAGGEIRDIITQGDWVALAVGQRGK